MASPSAPRPPRPAADEQTLTWLAELQGTSRTAAQARLHALLLRAARAETGRRAGQLRLAGPELDDIAHQAADDALVSILRKLPEFRGDSRFTTWVYKFVVFEVAAKISRHFWARAAQPLESEQWERLPDRFGFSPEQAAQSADLLAAVRDAVSKELTSRQRDAFVAIVVDGMPLDSYVHQIGSNRNAVYKAVFDARRKIRAYLVTNGHLGEDGTR
ncbi:RNA polymerase sigma factor [Actinocatenispora thailandica]|uniref:RNA polymerase sigma factor n=1 Tax=Actinocatenispora thailandica TaxID=227318 RepID=UPI001950A285|nr:sigma-70 family RNA polymerase sigma factor [Actinocatenispora thailandica]